MFAQLKKPPMLPEWTALIQPFHPDLWITYFVSTAICYLFMFLYVSFYPEADISSNGSIIYVMAVFLDESMDKTFKFNSNGMRYTKFLNNIAFAKTLILQTFPRTLSNDDVYSKCWL